MNKLLDDFSRLLRAHQFSKGLAGSWRAIWRAPLKVNNDGGLTSSFSVGSSEQQNNSVKHPETVSLFVYFKPAYLNLFQPVYPQNPKFFVVHPRPSMICNSPHFYVMERQWLAADGHYTNWIHSLLLFNVNHAINTARMFYKLF